MDIGVGDWVECVETDPCPTYGHLTVVGGIYCVEEVDPTDGTPWACDLHGECLAGGLRFVGHSVKPNYFFCEASFRPIYRPKQELIESLMVMQRATA